MRIIIENNQEKIEFNDQLKNIVENSINSALEFEKVNKNCEIGVTFVDNEEIKELNRQHRNIDNETDVLSFPLIDFSIEGDQMYTYDNDLLLLGDIVISLEKACVQADEYGHSLDREVGFLTVHSVLHLLGYDHDTDQNTKIMRKKEEEILNLINLKRE